MDVDQSALKGWFELLLAVSSVGGTIAALRVTVTFLKAEFAELKKSTRADITGIQTEIKQIGQILITQADMRGEIKVLETRIDAAERDIRDLRIGGRPPSSMPPPTCGREIAPTNLAPRPRP
ncbi:hypothetical protein BJ122_102281 [Rhodopseudomonas faecalis]|uniref:Uncharacterized protein n=1 Tax=Rhodopseudomonas faecalis TaxID=99655 RepID=A0A318TT83_9BRAD|nr:hypothetical protein [Rhodopseudomonas faecalis]PYF05055.1 hypothetical protein BJ122_102281 [Rhodopseudomonas faecalis]